MRTLLFVLTMASDLVLTSPASAAPYCDGYSAGYKKGCITAPTRCWSIQPRTCPRPRDNQSTYDEGFVRGHRDGEADAKRVRPCDRKPAPAWCSNGAPPPIGSADSQRTWADDPDLKRSRDARANGQTPI